MKKNILYYLLIVGLTMLTIYEGLSIPHFQENKNLLVFLKYSDIFLLAIVCLSYFIGTLKYVANYHAQDSLIEIGSGILFTFTSAFLIIFYSVQSTKITTAIDLLVIANAIFAIFLMIKNKEKIISIKHYIISFLLTGIVAFANL